MRSPRQSPVTFEDNAAYTDATRRPILYDLRRRVLSLNHRLQEVPTPKQRIAYNVPDRNDFLEVKVQRSAIRLNLIDGGQPDPTGIASKIPETNKWTYKLKIYLRTPQHLDEAMPLIEAAYRARR